MLHILLFADLVRERADNGPDGVVGIVPLQRQVKADKFLVVLHQLERLGTRADLFGDTIQFVIEQVAQALGENEREDVVLELGASFAPRMEQAASQIQDSRDMSLPLVIQFACVST